MPFQCSRCNCFEVLPLFEELINLAHFSISPMLDITTGGNHRKRLILQEANWYQLGKLAFYAELLPLTGLNVLSLTPRSRRSQPVRISRGPIEISAKSRDFCCSA